MRSTSLDYRRKPARGGGKGKGQRLSKTRESIDRIARSNLTEVIDLQNRGFLCGR